MSIPRFLVVTTLRSLVYAVSLLLSLSSTTYAEVRVYPGEYVVELNTSTRLALRSPAYLDDEFSSAITERVGDHAVLVKSSLRQALHRHSGTVPLDPEDTFCAELLFSGKAKSCSPNYEFRIEAVPQDEQLSTQWGLVGAAGIAAPQGWDILSSAQDVVVAVIDTGIDYRHPDLAQNMWQNPNEIPANGIDDDKNGYIDDVHGMNALNASGDPLDDNSHGTHVAGTIGAVANNTIGVSGVAWNVKLMGLKFLSGSGAGSLAGAIAALDYAVMMKRRGVNIRLTNNSWGGGGYSQPLEAAVKRSTDAGILFVVAAGNAGKNLDVEPSYPASFVNELALGVAAHDADTNVASFSNYGSAVALSAPGVTILSTVPGGGYAAYSGTSMAAPHVSGAAALAFQQNPALSAAEVRQRIMESGRDSASMAGITYSGRLLDLSRLLSGQFLPVQSTIPAPSSCTYDVVDIPFAPDGAAETEAVVLQADEMSFHTIALPFAFPFFGAQHSAVTVSPNGVVYMGSNGPGTLDFRNGTAAPAGSFAVLHTDLIMSGGSDGVRVATASDRVTIYWRARHYLNQQGERVYAWLSLYADGRAVSSMDFGDNTTRDLVAQSATVGVTGNTAAESVVVTTGGEGIRQKRSLQYALRCDGASQTSSVSQVYLQALNRRGEVVAKLGAGKKLGILLNGSGTGTIPATVSFDGLSCPQKSLLAIADGVGLFGATVRKEHESFRKIGVFVGGVAQEIAVTHKRLRSARRVPKRALLKKACKKLSFSPLQ